MSKPKEIPQFITVSVVDNSKKREKVGILTIKKEYYRNMMEFLAVGNTIHLGCLVGDKEEEDRIFFDAGSRLKGEGDA